jgi:DNA-binding PadR family transcriptional regulator
MEQRGDDEKISRSRLHRILLSFSTPKTPTQVENELGIKKLKLKPFVDQDFLRPLSPEAKKGRFYVLTDKARRALNLSDPITYNDKNWGLISWIMASPKQRLVVLQVVDSAKRTSEHIRKRASRFNFRLTRISTKNILKELTARGLIESEIIGLKRYYWINERGKTLVKELNPSVIDSNVLVLLGLNLANYLLIQFWSLLVVSSTFR